ncbi:MAG TPA: hypothetical protein VGP55_08515 [Chitinophagaceae bacterium]|nr:hypothetical protein [Chitinophagaceae bacterium]
MADTERISQPSLGSNELGTETNDTHVSTRTPAGSDTQLHKATKSGKKNNDNANDINDDEKIVKNNGNNGFLNSNETDE